jgi:hypothetical protein
MHWAAGVGAEPRGGDRVAPPDELPDAILTELKSEEARRHGLECERPDWMAPNNLRPRPARPSRAEIATALSDLRQLLTASLLGIVPGRAVRPPELRCYPPSVHGPKRDVLPAWTCSGR